MQKALIAMSGGVDSSVAAYLIQQQGRRGIGCTMKLYDAPAACGSRTCCALEDVEDARSVAYKLGMPYYVFNFTREFEEKVIQNFIHSYETGVTPNPCIECNRSMKFDLLYRRAMTLQCSHLVTGHYARIQYKDGLWQLKKGVDPAKDQSYVLYDMTQEQLAHTLFPLGGMHKEEIRRIAQEQGFHNAQKPDSQDICFVPDGDYASFLKQHSKKSCPPGSFLDTKGNHLGQHRGIIHYTIGQRRGLGITAPEPLYVCGINADTNTVVLGGREALYRQELTAQHFHWISGQSPSGSIRCKAKIRYRQIEQPATAIPLAGGAVKVVFDAPQRAITPGQAVVLYDGDVVLGGGAITAEG